MSHPFSPASMRDITRRTDSARRQARPLIATSNGGPEKPDHRPSMATSTDEPKKPDYIGMWDLNGEPTNFEVYLKKGSIDGFIEDHDIPTDKGHYRTDITGNVLKTKVEFKKEDELYLNGERIKDLEDVIGYHGLIASANSKYEKADKFIMLKFDPKLHKNYEQDKLAPYESVQLGFVQEWLKQKKPKE